MPLEVHHICLTDHARDVIERYGKKTGKSVDIILEEIVHDGIEDIETWKLEDN